MNWAIHLVVWWRVIKIRGLRIWCIRDPWVSSFYEWHQIRMVSWLQTYHDMIIWFWPKILPKNHHNFEIFIFLQKSESHRNYPIYKKRMVDFFELIVCSNLIFCTLFDISFAQAWGRIWSILTFQAAVWLSTTRWYSHLRILLVTWWKSHDHHVIISLEP